MRAFVVVLAVLASARDGAANVSPQFFLLRPPSQFRLNPPQLIEADEEEHTELSLHFIVGGGVGVLPGEHGLHLTREGEIGLELELHADWFKAVFEGALVLNGKFQAAIALAAMVVVRPRVALGPGTIVYLGLERGIGQPTFDAAIIGLAIDAVVTPKVQAMCVPGALVEAGADGHFVWGFGVSCHAAFRLTAGGHEL